MAKKTRAERKADRAKAAKSKGGKNEQPPPKGNATAPPPAVLANAPISRPVQQQQHPANRQRHRDDVDRSDLPLKWKYIFALAGVVLGGLALPISICGVVIGQRQVGEATKQTTIAAVAAQTAKNAAEAASASLRQANDSTAHELRAYLGIKMSIVEIKPGKVRGTYDVVCRIDLKNYGQTPAQEITVGNVCENVLDFPLIGEPEAGCTGAPQSPLHLAPQQEHSVPYVKSLEQGELNDLRARRKAWYVHVLMLYRDYRGDEQNKGQAFIAGGDTQFAKGELQGAEDIGLEQHEEQPGQATPSGSAPTLAPNRHGGRRHFLNRRGL